MRKKSLLLFLLPLLVLTASVVLIVPALGQTDAGACPALVQKALDEVGTNCDALDRNSACYGFNRVDATFAETQPEDFFSTPADRTGLVTLDTIQTAPLDTAVENWGIAVLNVQASLPNTLPGQAAVFLLLGDVELENAVPPEEALILGDSIPVFALSNANVRSAPSELANVVGGVAENDELQADALSADNHWLRVLTGGVPGWIFRDLVRGDDDVSALPTISGAGRTPMQAFTLRTGFGDPLCSESPPSLLVVQGPNNVRVDITVNGADIQIGSTIVLWLLPGNQMQLIVVSGSAKVGGLVIPEGFTIITGLNEDGTAPDGDGWKGLRPATAEELALLQALELIPPNLLHYPIFVPDVDDVNALQELLIRLRQNQQNQEGDESGQPGGLNNTRVIDCRALRPTSPLDGISLGFQTFYWNGIAGAERYRVTLYDENGQVVNSGETDAPNTSLTLDTSGGSGFTFSWTLEALVNGRVVCGAPPVSMFREAPAGPPDPLVTEEPQPVCNFNEICERSRGENANNCIDCQFGEAGFFDLDAYLAQRAGR